MKQASFRNAYLERTDFSHANLYKTCFHATSIKNEQLESAQSIQDAVLMDGTQIHDENLINTGKTSCNISLVNSWIQHYGNISTTGVSRPDKSSCEFILQSVDTGAIIYQRVNLSNKWNPTYWPQSQAVLHANISIGMSIELSGIQSNGQILARQTLST